MFPTEDRDLSSLSKTQVSAEFNIDDTSKIFRDV